MSLVHHIIDRIQMNYRDDYDDDFEEDERDERFTFLNHFKRNDQPEEDETMQVVLIRAESVEDSKEICDQLLSGNVVVVNMENASNKQKSRIIDFISGSVYGMNGNILSVSNSIYVTAPEDIVLSDGK